MNIGCHIDDEREYIYDLHQENDTVLKFELAKLPAKHGIRSAKLFGQQINDKIHAVGHDTMITTLPTGDVDYETRLFWRSDLVDQLLPERFGQQF